MVDSFDALTYHFNFRILHMSQDLLTWNEAGLFKLIYIPVHVGIGGGDEVTLSINLIQHSDFFEIVVTGTYNLQEAIDKFHYVLASCNMTGISKFLIDFRQLSGDRAALEKIIYAFEIQDRYFEHLAAGGQKLLVAYVGSPSQVSTYEPGLEIARKSDMPFTLFSSIEDAYEWLDVHAT